MKWKHGVVGLGVVVGVAFITLVALPAYGGTNELYTVPGFVEKLIDKGIIPSGMAEKARTFAHMISRSEDAGQGVDTPEGALNAQYAEVRVSQYIENGSRTYQAGQDITGLVLLLKNTSTAEEPIEFEAKRGCQVVYRIYDEDDTLLYDSSTSDKCQTTDRVTFFMRAGATRMFNVTHHTIDYRLDPGTYRFEVEYPEYGMGERTIEVE